MAKEKETPFEDALAKLEDIVEALERGEIPLDEALKKYEEGVKLSRLCSERLAQAEKKVEVLTKVLEGELKTEPFKLEEETEPSPKEIKKKSRKKEDNRPEGEKTLF